MPAAASACDGSQRAAARCRSEQQSPTKNHREREQRDHEATREPDTRSEHPAGTRRRFVLLDDLRLGSFALDDRGVERIEQVRLRVRVSLMYS